MKGWLLGHLRSLRHTVARMAAAPGATVANVLVIGVVLALPLAGYGLLVNVQSLTGAVPVEPQISVFLDSGPTKSDLEQLEVNLKTAPSVRHVRFVSRDAALAGLKGSPGMGEVINALSSNPLPDAYVLTLDSADPSVTQALERRLLALQGVAHVQVDSAWVHRLQAFLQLGRTTVVLLGTLLGVALVAVTFNTIRLQLLTYREEIEVSKLVGATDAYVRRPFLYFGTALGFLGAALALGLVALGFNLLNPPLSALKGLYGLDPVLLFFPAADSASVLLFAAILGWLGSYISVSRHLHRF